MNRLHLDVLRLIGTRKNYEITFKMGLNCISGPTSTGKTSILEMIDYALGAKKHKSYIEIGESCTEVELEFSISGKKYKLRRRLFDFSLPVRLDEWDTEEKEFKYIDTLEIDVPSNEHSLSSFLMGKLGLAEVKVANQFLSFRDVFKYSYLKQTDIDTENIMGESEWIKNLKRRAAFEIIYNIYDDMLAELNANLKIKREEFNEAKTKLDGVEQFIETTEIGSISKYRKQKKDIEDIIAQLKKQLLELKADDQQNNLSISNIRKGIIYQKKFIDKMLEQAHDQSEYIEKLKLLSNQYQNDISKCEMVLLGYVEINKYEFVVCPNCLKPLAHHADTRICEVCGNSMTDGVSDLLKIKKDMLSLKRRKSELRKHIENEEIKLSEINSKIHNEEKKLKEDENEIMHLSEGYINPQLEQIEYLNYEIGKYNRQLEEMDFNLKMLEEHERLRKLLKGKEDDINGIRKNISTLKAEHNDKHEIVQKVTTVFNGLLKDFKFPKLDFGYIEDKSYLPYARGRKYNDLGSLGGVSLLVMAYYISILETTLDDDKYYHLNLLLLDSPRKNLGADAAQEDFRDEEIFNSIIKAFIKLDEKHKDKMQMIVVNNGFPDFLPEDCLRVEFAANGQKGLIDDAP